LRMKFVCKGNGKDVLWSTYTLMFTISENFFRIAMQQMKIFSERKGGMSLNGISINRCE